MEVESRMEVSGDSNLFSGQRQPALPFFILVCPPRDAVSYKPCQQRTFTVFMARLGNSSNPRGAQGKQFVVAVITKSRLGYIQEVAPEKALDRTRQGHDDCFHAFEHRAEFGNGD